MYRKKNEDLIHMYKKGNIYHVKPHRYLDMIERGYLEMVKVKIITEIEENKYEKKNLILFGIFIDNLRIAEITNINLFKNEEKIYETWNLKWERKNLSKIFEYNDEESFPNKRYKTKNEAIDDVLDYLDLESEFEMLGKKYVRFFYLFNK